MKALKLLLLFFLVIILNNCSQTYQAKIDAVPSSDQMTDHKGIVTSEKKHAVSLSYYDFGMLDKKAKFIIIIENYGNKPIEFSNDNISVMFEGKNKDRSSIKIEIETPATVMKDVERELFFLKRNNKRNTKFVDVTDIPIADPKAVGYWAILHKKWHRRTENI